MGSLFALAAAFPPFGTRHRAAAAGYDDRVSGRPTVLLFAFVLLVAIIVLFFALGYVAGRIAV